MSIHFSPVKLAFFYQAIDSILFSFYFHIYGYFGFLINIRKDIEENCWATAAIFK